LALDQFPLPLTGFSASTLSASTGAFRGHAKKADPHAKKAAPRSPAQVKPEQARNTPAGSHSEWLVLASTQSGHEVTIASAKQDLRAVDLWTNGLRVIEPGASSLPELIVELGLACLR